jgi:hypothetical protein
VACINSVNYLGHADWRLPNINELQSLINAQESNHALWLTSSGFLSVQANFYWSSTTRSNDPEAALTLSAATGAESISSSAKGSGHYVWPVRGGQSSAADSSRAANIWKTGQSASYSPGDDGALKKGVFWPSPRLIDNGDGTVKDNLTGLVWLKDANCFGAAPWNSALSSANALAEGQCGLTDGSISGQWRLPDREELHSLSDFSKYSPALPAGHPFTNVQLNAGGYFSSTTHAAEPAFAWVVDMAYGDVNRGGKIENYYIWPVRGGTDMKPDAFSFIDQTDAPLDTVVVSNTITVAGVNSPSPVSVNGGQYAVNGGTFTAAAGAVNNGDALAVRLTSAGSFSGTSETTLTIGGVSATFSVTTMAVDTTPDPFVFADQAGVALSTVITSNSITVVGINSASPISINGGEYSVNGGGFTSAPGTVNNGDMVIVRVTSSGAYSTTMDATLTIGGVNDMFSVTTQAPPTFTISFSSTGSGAMTCAPTSVQLGGNFQCSVIPASGHYLESLTDNSVNVTSLVANDQYSVTNVTADRILSATFHQNLPVLRLTGTDESWHSGIQAAYNAASGADNILSWASDFYESLDLNRNIALTIYGGWDTNFELITGMTTIHGSMTVGPGRVGVHNLTIQFAQ